MRGPGAVKPAPAPARRMPGERDSGAVPSSQALDSYLLQPSPFNGATDGLRKLRLTVNHTLESALHRIVSTTDMSDCPSRTGPDADATKRAGFRPTKERSAGRTAQRVVERIIACAVQGIVWWGWYVSVLEIGVGWLWRRERRYVDAAAYIATCTTLLPLISRTHLYLSIGRTTHSVPTYSAPSLSEISTPYESLSDGTLSFCSKCPDGGGGRWKPPTTHHCSACGVCRQGFDHHCPWLANCVTAHRLKPFLLLLYTTALAVPIAVLPIRRPVLTHVFAALRASRADPYARAVWWDRWYSWLFVGGPPGRWIVGAVLGFRKMRRDALGGGSAAWLDGSLVARPHMGLALLVTVGSLLSVFCLVLAVLATRDAINGQSTLDTIRLRVSGARPTGRFITLLARERTSGGTGTSSGVGSGLSDSEGSSVGEGGRRTYAVLPGERVYDLGWRENWARVWRAPWFPSSDVLGKDERYRWPKINPAVLRRLAERERERIAE